MSRARKGRASELGQASNWVQYYVPEAAVLLDEFSNWRAAV